MFFPPSRASGTYRPLGMANHLAREGWAVTVVTVTPDFFDTVTGSRDDSLLEQIEPGVTVVRVPLPSQHLQTDVRRMTFLRAHLAALYQARTVVLQRWLFPDKYHTWIRGVVSRVVAIDRRQPVDVVLATGNPWSAFRAAWTIRRVRRIPYVMDYRDSWTLDQFTEGDAYPPESLETRWERRLIARAARVVFVNEPMREWHASRYPESAHRMLVVQNGFDPDVMPTLPFAPPRPEFPLRFGYVGTVTAQLPHSETWRGWIAAREEPELKGSTAHLFGHMGFFPRDQERIRTLLPDERTSGVRWEGPLDKTEVSTAYRKLDVLLMMIPSSRYVTAGKTYEYMATGKPIVAIHTPETAASEPLRGYPAVFGVTDLSAESITTALVAAARAARTMTEADYRACLAHAQRYRRDTQLEPLVRALEEVAHA